MRVATFNPTETTVVYVKRDNSIKMKTIIDFANSFYGIGGIDFIVLDLCLDCSALDVVAKNGDPFRYFGLDSGVTIDSILADPQKYSRFSSIVVVDQNDVL